MDLLPPKSMPTVFIVMGLWAILAATVLNRPLNWVNHRLDAVYRRWWGPQSSQYRHWLWMRATPTRLWTGRVITLVIGVSMLLIGLTLASGYRLPSGK